MADRNPYLHHDGRQASYWQKDGAWHVTEPYIPTENDRIMFPQSYPREQTGPFFKWTEHTFNSKTEAIHFLKTTGKNK